VVGEWSYALLDMFVQSPFGLELGLTDGHFSLVRICQCFLVGYEVDTPT
jgi:hypothetical protein